MKQNSNVLIYMVVVSKTKAYIWAHYKKDQMHVLVNVLLISLRSATWPCQTSKSRKLDLLIIYNKMGPKYEEMDWY